MKKKNIKIDEFMDCCARLSILEFVGLAKLLKVSLVNENQEAREFDKILKELLDNYANSNRKRRRYLLQLVQKATKEKDYHKAGE